MREYRNVVVTGGCGFIGKSLINKLLETDEYSVFNIDKLSYQCNLDFDIVPNASYDKDYLSRYKFFNFDLLNENKTFDVISEIKPDIVFNLAAETHVDRSIDSPKEFLNSNILGTFNLLQACNQYWKKLPSFEKDNFRFVHISTDEVYGSLTMEGQFNEDSKYCPRSPYSATKASSDHLVKSWFHTYGLPTIVTNCSNNFGPWQFPEKLIPLIIMKCLAKETIPIYGDGSNIRDWLYVIDHVNALILVAKNGRIGESYCIGGNSEKTNLSIAKEICEILDELSPKKFNYSSLITFVEDRPGHDFRYAIDSSKIFNELNWKPKYSFFNALKSTVNWYLNNLDWCNQILTLSGYGCERLGKINIE